MRIINNKGLSIELNGLNIGLDSQSANNDLSFISHAHTDHLIKNTLKPVLSSILTSKIANERLGINYKVITQLPGTKMINSGHVPGGKSLLLTEQEGSKTLFTSDFSPHDRYFLKGLKPVKCDNLIIETTYGSPEYNLPLPNEVISRARDIIQDDLAKGHNVTLWGYAFGKAQILTKMVEGLGPVSADEPIRRINELCNNQGLPVSIPLKKNKDFKGVYLTSSRTELKKMKSKNYSFTGWGYAGVNECFKLSDHASFTDLLKFIKQCSPSMIYTMHGFSKEFAQLLKIEGYNAKAI